LHDWGGVVWLTFTQEIECRVKDFQGAIAEADRNFELIWRNDNLGAIGINMSSQDNTGRVHIEVGFGVMNERKKWNKGD
jgi:hypothetical protein